MKVERTGQVVKVDINYTPNLHKFIDSMTWNVEDFINLAGNKVSPSPRMELQVVIEPDFLLLPAYKYLPIPNEFVLSKIEFEPKHEDRIKIENLSTFEVCKVVNNPNDVNIILEVGLHLSSGVVNPWMMGVNFEFGPKNDYRWFFEYSYASSLDTSFIWYEDYFRTLRWARGRKYSNFARLGCNSNVFHNLYSIEKLAFAFVNFLYTLYTMDTSKDKASFEYNLFKPYAELLRSYGNTFEEALSIVNEAMVLTL